MYSHSLIYTCPVLIAYKKHLGKVILSQYIYKFLLQNGYTALHTLKSARRTYVPTYFYLYAQR